MASGQGSHWLIESPTKIETWLDSDYYSDYLPNDYEFCHRNRLSKKGAIYVHKSLKYRILKTCL